MQKIVIVLIISLWGNVLLSSHRNIKWGMHIASIPLTFMNYYFLHRLVLPSVHWSNNIMRAQGLPETSTALAISLLWRHISPKFGYLLPILSKDDWEEAQANAVMYATAYYMLPNVAKEKINILLQATRRHLFSKKEKFGLSVKDVELSEQLLPQIKEKNNAIAAGIAESVKLDNALQLIKKKGSNDQEANVLNQKKVELAKRISGLFVERENLRNQVYDRYPGAPEKKLSEDILAGSQDDLVLNRFIELKNAYFGAKGGVLGVLGEALKYFED